MIRFWTASRLMGAALALCLLATGCQAGAAPAAPAVPEPHGIDPATRFTPLTASALTAPMAVLGTDERLHLAYELVLTNATLVDIAVQRVEVADATSHRVLLSLQGPALAAAMTPLGTPPPAGSEAGDAPAGEPPPDSTTLPASSVGVVWLDVQLATQAAVPSVLEHQVVAAIGGRTASFAVARVATSRSSPVVLGPPLQSGTWYASEGCCTDATHHRRGLAPIDGALYVPQRFAIDWFLLDGQHRTWVGDPTKPSSYLSFEQPVVAAADGTVVDVQDGLKDSSPPEPPPLPPIQDTVGNHVILQMGSGLFLLYAHLERCTLHVRQGQVVHRGQVLGLIGTSGNSTTPHLHFQVLTSATFFPSDSPPFVFDHFQLLGRITSRLWDDNLGLQPTGALPFQAASPPGQRRLEMPLDRDVVSFAGQG